MSTVTIRKRWIAGHYRYGEGRNWITYLPVWPFFGWSSEPRWRHICAVGLGFGPHAFYVGRW